MRARAFGKWIAKTKPLRFPHKKKIIPEEMTFVELREAALSVAALSGAALSGAALSGAALSVAPLSGAAAVVAEAEERKGEEEEDKRFADGLRSDRTNRVFFIRIKRR